MGDEKPLGTEVSLDAETIPYPGYNPGDDNDEVRNDFASQSLFEHDNHGEDDGTNGEIKRYTGKGWYVLLHPVKHNGFANYAILLAVGRSPHGKRLVGVVTPQVCHTLCD